MVESDEMGTRGLHRYVEPSQNSRTALRRLPVVQRCACSVRHGKGIWKQNDLRAGGRQITVPGTGLEPARGNPH